jgi:hypothetical protein
VLNGWNDTADVSVISRRYRRAPGRHEVVTPSSD